MSNQISLFFNPLFSVIFRCIGVIVNYSVVLIGAMYGANTHEKDLYKNLFTDASVFINRDRELSNDGRDRISIYNYAPVGGIEWALPNTPQALRAGKCFLPSR